jgi:hypothetical protein
VAPSARKVQASARIVSVIARSCSSEWFIPSNAFPNLVLALPLAQITLM